MCNSAHLRSNAKIAFFFDIANRYIAACLHTFCAMQLNI
jgi:hypothetical protein